MEFLGHNLNDDKRNCASFVLFQVPRGNILNKLKLRLSFRFPSVLVPIARTASLEHYLVPAGPTSHRNQKAFKLAIKLQLATFPSSLFPRFLITWTGVHRYMEYPVDDGVYYRKRTKSGHWRVLHCPSDDLCKVAV